MFRKKKTDPPTAGTFRTAIERSGSAACDTIQLTVDTIKKMDVPWAQKCDLLRSDISKIPHHLLGDHTQCDIGNNFGCKVNNRGLQEVNYVPEMQQKNWLNDYESCFNRGLRNVESLLNGLTTNLSESFNAHVARKCVSKRVEMTLGTQYDARV